MLAPSLIQQTRSQHCCGTSWRPAIECMHECRTMSVECDIWALQALLRMAHHERFCNTFDLAGSSPIRRCKAQTRENPREVVANPASRLTNKW